MRHLVLNVTSITVKLLDGFWMRLVNLPVVGDSSPTNQQVLLGGMIKVAE